ncbi:MAG: hypothetical protein EXR77_06765 [Myxococcales bacterium]|nr:hypothetical protein [Myxococcales bacterium]
MCYSRWSLKITLILTVFATACQPNPAERGRSPMEAPVQPQLEQDDDDAGSGHRRPAHHAMAEGEGGLRFRLRNADPAADSVVAPPKAVTTPLTAAETAKLLARLPKLVALTGDAQPFALRDKSLPAPRPRETVPQAFPPLPTAVPPPAVDAGPLQVLRHGPDGDVELAPRISLTFSQPMVPMTDHASLGKLPIPAQVTPTVAGEWRWLGTQTLIFQPKERLPMATEYAVVVPMGTRSQTGGALPAEFRFAFRTPAPRLLHYEPQGYGHPVSPVIFGQFDQAVDPEQIGAKIKLLADGKTVSFKVLTKADLIANPAYKWRLEALDKDGHGNRWVALQASSELPKNVTVRVNWGPHLPSAEGPRTSAQVVHHSFRTYGPLAFTGGECGWRNECPPLNPFYLHFSNTLDTNTFDPKWVTVDPPVPNWQVVVGGSGITASGLTRGNTKYTVHIATELRDIYSQILGKVATATFKTTRAQPAFSMQGGPLMVLDPAQKTPQLAAWTVNYRLLKMQVWRVEPKDWWQWRKAQRDQSDGDKQPRPPGVLAIDRLVNVGGVADEVTETALELAPALHGKHGHVLVHVQPVPQPKESWRQAHFWAWVQVTQLGVTAIVDHAKLVGWATDLTSGKPAAGAQLHLIDDTKGDVALPIDADGNAVFALPDSSNVSRMVVAKRGADSVMLPERDSSWGDGSNWHRSDPGSHTVWHTVDDRGLYKPGETARIKGWLRTLVRGPKGDVQAYGGANHLYWRLRDARGNDVLKGKLPVAPTGSFDLAVELPGNLHLGHAQLVFSYAENGWDRNHPLRVDEFRRPEFESTTQTDPGPYVIGDHALVSTLARYYAGGALPNAEVQWQVNASPGSFSPTGWDGWGFGKPTPWWMRWWRANNATTSQSLTARLTSAGQHVARIDFDGAADIQPYALTAHATVFDVNRQAWSSQAHLVVHPAAVYAGLKLDKAFLQAGETIEVGVIATDLAGKAKAGLPVQVRMYRERSEQVAGQWEKMEVDIATCAWTSTEKPGNCSFSPKGGGSWQIEATLHDEQGRRNVTKLQLYVSGKDDVPDRSLPQDQVQLVPDKKEYAPGSIVKLLVIAPWNDAEGELTVAREGRVSRRHFRCFGKTATLEIPIEQAHTPNLVAHVAMLGQTPRDGADGQPDPKLPLRPAHAHAEITLPIPPVQRTLQVKVVPLHPDAAPKQKTHITVQVLDSAGKPQANAEVLVVMADDAVLALTGYRISTPLGSFYPLRGGGLALHEVRRWLMLAAGPALRIEGVESEPRYRNGHGGVKRKSMASKKGEDMAMGAGAPMEEPSSPQSPPPPSPEPKDSKKETRESDKSEDKPTTGATDDASAPAPIALRKDFNPLAVFAPAVKTDANGNATVEVTLPDNLTRYRVMVVAASEDKLFGLGDATVVARLPLMVRPSAPRFANFGDQFELPVVLQNQTPTPLVVQIAARSTVLQVAALGYRLTIAAHDRVEVRIPTTAPSAGTGRVQLAVATGSFADAAEISLPVWTPATTEAFATYGVLDSGADKTSVRAQPIRTPKDVVKQFGGLQITTSSTALQGLTDAVLYLVRYPFECSEQRASRMLSIAALRDVLKAFAVADLPSDAELEASMVNDIKALGRLQNYDGGFGFWKKGDQSWPVTTLHATLALVRAKAKGYTVPEKMLKQALYYCKHIDNQFTQWYGHSTRRVLRAQALYVLLQAGNRDVAKARALLAEVKKIEDLSLEALGWIWPVLVGDKASTAQLTAIRTHVGNRVEEQAGAAHFTVRYDDGAHLLLASDRRADAVLLDALMTDDPKSDLIPKIVKGLLAHRKKGRWGSTQENAWVLLALDRYFRTFEKVTPDFVARLWLGDQYAGEQAFRGRSTDRQEVSIPMAFLLQGPADRNLLLQKTGDGRLYYRIGLNYAPIDLKLPPLDRGFFVQRRYEAVDQPDDVKRDADGTWRVKAGARVRVRVEMVAPARRYHVALVDPLPAGFEAINGDLLGSQPPPDVQPTTPSGGQRWWWGRWYEHDNLRDERAEAFTSLLWEGDWEYAYLCRATTPGTFVAPPAKAEEMYSPEVFGRSGTDRVVVVGE